MLWTYPIIWLIIMILFIILEIITYQYVSIWFVFGSMVSLILAIFDVSFKFQIAAFFIVSILLLILTRPIVAKWLSKKATPTNADRIIGETGVVIDEIDNIKAKGAVRVLNQNWSARSIDNTIIEKDQIVKIIKIEGVKAIVEKIK